VFTGRLSREPFGTQTTKIVRIYAALESCQGDSHCERSEAIQLLLIISGLLRFARNDDSRACRQVPNSRLRFDFGRPAFHSQIFTTFAAHFL
jgi:hypothetical protein